MINAALENTTTMAMGPDNDAVRADSIKYELGIRHREAIEAFLDNVIAIEIFDQFDDLVLQGVDDCLDLRTISKEAFCEGGKRAELTCSGVEMNSIIFCSARVPC